MDFYQHVNELEDAKDVKGLEVSLEWLNVNIHGIKHDECVRRKKYVQSALDWILENK